MLTFERSPNIYIYIYIGETPSHDGRITAFVLKSYVSPNRIKVCLYFFEKKKQKKNKKIQGFEVEAQGASARTD